MKRWLVLAAFSALGCGSNRTLLEPSPDGSAQMPFQIAIGSIPFTPATVSLNRSGTCGVVQPEFKDTDPFELTIDGAAQPASAGSTCTAPTEISLNFHRTVPLNQDLDVVLETFNPSLACAIQGGSVAQPNQDVSFSWELGENANEVDAQPLTSVTLHFSQFPHQDGDPLVLAVKMLFADGKVFEFVTRPLLVSAAGPPCG